MSRVKLSQAFVKSACCVPGSKKTDFFDTAQRGFLLEVRRSGGRTYYQRYTDKRGRERQFKIGPAHVLSLALARRKARETLAEALLGDDPQERRLDLRSIPTLNELVRDRYLPYVKSYKRSWRTDETVLRLHIVPALGTQHVDLIRAESIIPLIDRMRAEGYSTGTTNRVVIVLRHIFNLAKKWQVPGVKQNATAGINLAPDVIRERFLSIEEARRLISSIESDDNRVASQAIFLLLLTGARRNEITHARWEEVNWNKRTLLVPRAKSGKPREIALNAAATELLQAMRHTNNGNPYIFPSPVTGLPPASLFFPWDRIRQRAGLSDLRLHDLRHSFASFLVNNGVSLYVVQGLLGHANSKYTQRYAHLTPDTLRDAAETVGSVIATARGFCGGATSQPTLRD